MTILIVMGGFFPGIKYGGPPVSVDNFCSLLFEEECFILTHDHDLGENAKFSDIRDGWNDRGNCKVLYVSDCEYKTKTFESIINELHPDLIYLQGLFQSCVFPCLFLAKKYRLPVLLAPRGELCVGALNLKKYKKIPYIMLVKVLGFAKKIHWQSTSNDETDAIKKWMNVDNTYIHELPNVPSIPRRSFERGVKIAGEGRFVFLSRIHPKKNLLSAISFFQGTRGKAFFDIYGPIEDIEYWKRCQEEIKKLPENVIVVYKGLVTHDQVHEVLSKYDAFLFPTLSENYGHVIAESLAVGTPVIISDQTPWSDVNNYKAGKALPLNHSEAFTEEINRIINCNDNSIDCKNVKNYFMLKTRLESVKENYISAISTIISKS